MSWSNIRDLKISSLNSTVIDCQMLRVKGKAVSAEFDSGKVNMLCETVKKLGKEIVVLKNRVSKLELLKLGKNKNKV